MPPRFVGMKTFFFFNDTATADIYTLSQHDPLPIYKYLIPEDSHAPVCAQSRVSNQFPSTRARIHPNLATRERSEEHTSELQSQSNIVCRLLLQKKIQLRGCQS